MTIGQTQKLCGMKDSEQDYVDQFNFGLVEVVYEWARGKPFGEIVALTDVQEGVIGKKHALKKYDQFALNTS